MLQSSNGRCSSGIIGVYCPDGRYERTIVPFSSTIARSTIGTIWIIEKYLITSETRPILKQTFISRSISGFRRMHAEIPPIIRTNEIAIQRICPVENMLITFLFSTFYCLENPKAIFVSNKSFRSEYHNRFLSTSDFHAFSVRNEASNQHESSLFLYRIQRVPVGNIII